MIEKIQKRNGSVVAFDSMKIMSAISRANKAVEGEEMTPTDMLFLTEKVCHLLDDTTLNTVEQVQDKVERMPYSLWLCKNSQSLYFISSRAYKDSGKTESDLWISIRTDIF